MPRESASGEGIGVCCEKGGGGDNRGEGEKEGGEKGERGTCNL